MNHLQKLRAVSIFKWVSSNFAENQLKLSKTPVLLIGSSSLITQKTRLYGAKRAVQTENPYESDSDNAGQICLSTRKEAQDALVEYFYSTRSLQFLDAENMGRNSPHFLEKLLKKARQKAEIGRSIARFLRYHPINEFEPFLESLGLKPSEYVPLLPRDFMFLSDDHLLLANYYVLCNYGFERNAIGKIYKEATEVFQYDSEVLLSKLRAYEELGLSQPSILNFVVASPYLLTGDVNADFIKVLEKLKSLGFENSWIEGNLLEKISYNWSRMIRILCLFSKIGCSNEQLVGLIRQHPDTLFEGSGDKTHSLIGFLVKFGSTTNQICTMFLRFPQIRVGQFVSNMCKCFLFLSEIDMEVTEIGKIVSSHSLLLGSCSLKKTNSLLANLNIGKKRLCSYIQENPQEMKNWVMGMRVKPLPNSGEDLRSQMEKNQFLLDLGFVENSNEMKTAAKTFRGKGGELQERFDCIVEAGLDRKDVCNMIKTSPQILNQTKNVIEMKIGFLLNDLGYPISSLVTFPSYLSYTVERVKLRCSMYNWLVDQGSAEPMLALSTIIACSDKIFIKQYVNHHPSGPQIWKELKEKIYSS
ncbi:transcription termination factor MTEF18, mitochondrial [Ziziphus jujuba]|uniref:Transcription termination factor MTEF18, mitochondrial n=1 Tax=Ziziphus jujuba TaxID=326968 RepID=A0A6P4B9E4_ZIZJJ|nr:transcription termination factor MTEF18, mitochondrial [Ziziphus jujuba]